MAYFEPGSRSCLRCGSTVSEPKYQTHIDFHERIDPEPVEEPTPEPEPEVPSEDA